MFNYNIRREGGVSHLGRSFPVNIIIMLIMAITINRNAVMNDVLIVSRVRIWTPQYSTIRIYAYRNTSQKKTENPATTKKKRHPRDTTCWRIEPSLPATVTTIPTTLDSMWRLCVATLSERTRVAGACAMFAVVVAANPRRDRPARRFSRWLIKLKLAMFASGVTAPLSALGCGIPVANALRCCVAAA